MLSKLFLWQHGSGVQLTKVKQRSKNLPLKKVQVQEVIVFAITDTDFCTINCNEFFSNSSLREERILFRYP